MVIAFFASLVILVILGGCISAVSLFLGVPFKIHRIRYGQTRIVYKGGRVFQIVNHITRSWCFVWFRDKTEIIGTQSSFHITAERTFITKDKVSITIKTVLEITFLQGWLSLPTDHEIGWKRWLFDSLFTNTLTATLKTINFDQLQNSIVHIFDEVNSKAVVNAKNLPIYITSVKYEPSGISPFSVYRSELAIRERAKLLEEAQSKEASA